MPHMDQMPAAFARCVPRRDAAAKLLEVQIARTTATMRSNE